MTRRRKPDTFNYVKRLATRK